MAAAQGRATQRARVQITYAQDGDGEGGRKELPFVLGVLGALGWLLPWVGVLLAVIPALLVGLAISPVSGLGAALLTLAVLSFLEFVIEPRFFNRRRFSSLLVVIVVLVLADQFGLIGFILAPPLAAVIQITAGQLIRSTTVTTLVTTQSLSQVTALQERLQAVQALVAEEATPSTPEIINLLDRLKQLIERAQDETRSYRGFSSTTLTRGFLVGMAITSGRGVSKVMNCYKTEFSPGPMEPSHRQDATGGRQEGRGPISGATRSAHFEVRCRAGWS